MITSYRHKGLERYVSAYKRRLFVLPALSSRRQEGASDERNNRLLAKIPPEVGMTKKTSIYLLGI